MNEGTKLQPLRDELSPCVHHWILTDPEAGTVFGHCRRCGGERAFSSKANSPEEIEGDLVASSPAQLDAERLAT